MSERDARPSVSRSSEELREVAARRLSAVRELADLRAPTKRAVEEAADSLGVDASTVYRMLRRYRAGADRLSDFIPKVSSGGRGRSRLPAEVDAVIDEQIELRYLRRERITVATLWEHVHAECDRLMLASPSYKAVATRVKAIDPKVAARAREGRDGLRKLESSSGETPRTTRPLQRVQIDHTPVDIIVVSEAARSPLGRPYLTVAVDDFSRSVVGFYLTMDPPSEVSVAMCLANVVEDKGAYLRRLDIDGVWPMCGRPEELYLDNAAEFWSAGLKRGCEEHGIRLSHRPIAQPQYGGVVERLIGTLMKRTHELPGTTFSNTVERGRYESEARAALTLHELEQWLAGAIAIYHLRPNKSTGLSPIRRWEAGVASYGVPAVTDPVEFALDFLPVVTRAITREGFRVNGERYYCHALRPWIENRDRVKRFAVRCDPRDVGRIWVEPPDGGALLEVPARSLQLPPISSAELRLTRAKTEKNETDLQRLAVLRRRMNTIADGAIRTTRRGTKGARGARAVQPVVHLDAAPIDDHAESLESVRPFEDLETW